MKATREKIIMEYAKEFVEDFNDDPTMLDGLSDDEIEQVLTDRMKNKMEKYDW